MKIDILNAKKTFKEYVKNYDAEDEKVKLKISHIERVSQIAKKIAEGLNLSEEDIELAFSMPAVSLEVECASQSIMNVAVPRLILSEKGSEKAYPYAFAAVTSEADYSVRMMGKTVYKLVKLAETEKTAQMLADEIEKGKRRVNALENIMIPSLEETIKYISMKLEENDRSSRTRLMKVKSMLEEGAR